MPDIVLLWILNEIICITVCINCIYHLAQCKAQNLVSVVQLLILFSECHFPSDAPSSKSIGLLFSQFFFFFLLVYLPLIISLSYSKGHRLCFLSGDTEMEINICQGSKLVEGRGEKKNWTREEIELQHRLNKLWSISCVHLEWGSFLLYQNGKYLYA